jgi:hypothetical protein
MGDITDGRSMPTRDIGFGCCPCAAKGHAAAALPSPAMNSRRPVMSKSTS